MVGLVQTPGSQGASAMLNNDLSGTAGSACPATCLMSTSALVFVFTTMHETQAFRPPQPALHLRCQHLRPSAPASFSVGKGQGPVAVLWCSRDFGQTAACCAGQLYLTLVNEGNVSGLMTSQVTSCCTAPYGGGRHAFCLQSDPATCAHVCCRYGKQLLHFRSGSRQCEPTRSNHGPGKARPSAWCCSCS